MLFALFDHGAWITKAGIDHKVLRAIIGNPLIAITMLRRDVTAGLFAPVEVLLTDEPEGRSSLTYMRPSSLMVIDNNPELLSAARGTRCQVGGTGRQGDGSLSRQIVCVADGPGRGALAAAPGPHGRDSGLQPAPASGRWIGARETRLEFGEHALARGSPARRRRRPAGTCSATTAWRSCARSCRTASGMSLWCKASRLVATWTYPHRDLVQPVARQSGYRWCSIW